MHPRPWFKCGAPPIADPQHCEEVGGAPGTVGRNEHAANSTHRPFGQRAYPHFFGIRFGGERR